MMFKIGKNKACTFSFIICALTLLTLPALAQLRDTTLYLGGSPFVDGFARVEPDSATSFYIDSTGRRAFDEVLQPNDSYGVHHFLDKGQATNTDTANDLPKNYVLVRKDHKVGVLSSTGHWLLKPIYDAINTRFSKRWKITKNGKQSYYGPQGFLLPFKFDSLNYLDGQHFDVKKRAYWGVYDAQTDKMIIPPKYQKFDYCGGCEAKGNYVFAQKNNKWGIVNFDNDVLIPFEYEHHHINMRSDERVESLYKNGKAMLINLKTGAIRTRKSVEQSDEDRTEEMAQGFVRKRKNDKWGMFNAAGKQILPYKYDFILYRADSTRYGMPAPFVGISKDEKRGIADTTGTIIIPPEYRDWFGCKYNKQSFTSHRDGKDVVLDRSGQQVLPHGAKDIEEIDITNPADSSRVELLTYKQNRLYGFYNPINKHLIKPTFTKLNQNYGALKTYIKVSKGNSVGLVDANGQTTIPLQYEQLYSYNPDFPKLVRVKRNGKYGYFDIKKRKEIIPVKYDQVTIKTFDDHRTVILLVKGHHTGLATLSGKALTPVIYRDILTIDATHFLLIQKGKPDTYKIFNVEEGKTYALPQNDGVRIAHEGTLVILFVDREAKLYDVSTRKVIRGNYAKNGFPAGLSTFYHHWARIKKHGEVGYINPKGKIVIPVKYHNISSFERGLARVTLNQLATDQLSYGFIDSTNHAVVPIKYDDLPDAYSDDYFKDKFLVLYKQADSGYYRQGLATREGTVLIPPKYNKIYPSTSDKRFLVKKDSKYGILNKQGKVIVPVKYENIMLDKRILLAGDKAQFSFPLLCAKKDYWEYVQDDGTTLPFRVKNRISFNKSRYSY